MPDSPELAVSTVIFALREDPQGRLRLALPLVRRIRSPFEGFWALPGGPLGAAESLADAAARTLEQTTGLETNYLEQLYAFGGINRSARQGQQGGEQLAARGRPIGNDRVVSIVYWALVGAAEAEHTRDDPNVKWQFIGELPELAFDHNLIVECPLWRL